MKEICSSFGAWLFSNVEQVLTLCFILYLAFALRFTIYWFSLYRMPLSKWPETMSIPKDVIVGTVVAVVVACGSVDLDILLRELSLPTILIQSSLMTSLFSRALGV